MHTKHLSHELHHRLPRYTAVGVFLFAITVALSGCSSEGQPVGPSPPQVEAVASIQLTAAVDTLVILGESAVLGVAVRDADGNALSGRTVTWSSSDEAVATVADSATDAVVNALAAGVVTITAESEGVSASIAMRVVDLDPDRLQQLLADEYTQLVLASGAPGAGELSDMWDEVLDDLAARFITGVYEGLDRATALVPDDATGDEAVLFAVLALILEHAHQLLDRQD